MDHLRTEANNPASVNLDQLTPLQLVRLMNAEDALVISSVASQAEAIARAMDVIATRLRGGGRLLYVGAGTSGRLGVLDAAECPPTFNSPPEQVVGVIAGGQAALTRAVEGAEDHPELAERDLQQLALDDKDVLVGIATSGRTPYVLGAIEYARRQGAFVIGLACNPDAELIGLVDLAITPVVGPEILSGSTRLKAGTATKLVLNMLSTGAMVQLNKTFGNFMVDLRVTNRKLAARANRIVRQLTGLDEAEADRLLRQCGGEVKTALAAHLAGVTPEEARRRLDAAAGRVREVLETSGAAAFSQAPMGESERLILGIDGGGTHTVALLARLGGDLRFSIADLRLVQSKIENRQSKIEIVGRGEAGPSNLQAVGREKALAALEQGVARAFGAAGLPRVPVTAACLGLAGAGRPEEQAFLRDWAERIGLSDTVEVTTDVHLLLASGTPEGWGVALVAGTGSIALAQDRDGRTARAGGWGRLLGDEGSGYALALSGLRAVLRAADGRNGPTLLTQRLLSALNLNDPQGLVTAVYGEGVSQPVLAALAPMILAAAEEGDATAAEIVRKGAVHLAGTVVAAVRKLGLEQETIPLALAGGVFAASLAYRDRVLQSLASLGLKAAPVHFVAEPAVGALWLAARRTSSGIAGA